MPELPEVQTIVTELNRQVLRRRVLSCRIFRSAVIRGDADGFTRRVTGRKIAEIKRRGKYILIVLDCNVTVVTHLRMTGKFVIAGCLRRRHRHDRLAFLLHDGRKLVFNDPRVFGRLEICNDIAKHSGLAKLGWEPWDEEISASELRERLKGSAKPVKSLLLDQSFIAGIGNIYASEILYDAGIHPARKSNSLDGSELIRLIRSLRKILKKAIAENGTSISDYRRVDNKTGNFQRFLKVYGREGESCVRCSKPIRKLRQNQRSSFLCSSCQK